MDEHKVTSIIPDSLVLNKSNEEKVVDEGDRLEKVGSNLEQQSANQNKLFVGNLHQSTSEGDLIKLFQFCGNVLSIDYVWHKSGPLKGMPKGFAFIEMDTVVNAQRAVARLNGQVVRGKKLLVAPKADGNGHQQSTSSSTSVTTAASKKGSTSDVGMQYKRQSLSNPNIAGAKRSAIVASCIDDNIKKLKATLQNNL
jgi:RNA recognition motif-containing protein